MSEVKRYSAHWSEVWDETDQDWAEPRTDGVISYEFVLATDYDAKCAELTAARNALLSEGIRTGDIERERDRLRAALEEAESLLGSAVPNTRFVDTQEKYQSWKNRWAAWLTDRALPGGTPLPVYLERNADQTDEALTSETVCLGLKPDGKSKIP